MKYNPDIHHRKSIRLKEYDYSQDGMYFMTICTHDRKCLFGKITNDSEMILNNAGQMAKLCWEEIPKHYPFVALDEFVIMPNHVHGILIIDNSISGMNNKNITRANDYFPTQTAKDNDSKLANNVGANDYSPLRTAHDCNRNMVRPHGTSKTIGAIVRGFKIGVTKWFRANTEIYTVWQRNYYEHIIRNEKSLEKIREYILNNCYTWEKDKLFKP